METTQREQTFAARHIISLARDDRSGSVAITVALLLPVLVAAMALVFDAGYYRWRERVLQTASDAAAMAAGQDAAAGLVSSAQMFYAANQEAVRNGFMDGNFRWNGGVGVVSSTPQGSIQVNSPPAQSPAYKGQTGYVEVILTENRPRMFSALWQGAGTQPVVSVSVVSTSGGTTTPSTVKPIGSGCLLVLDPSGQGAFTAMQIGTGSGLNRLNVVSAGCETVVNSNAKQALNTNFNSDYSNSTNQIWYPGLLTLNSNVNPGTVFGTVYADGTSFGGWGTYQIPNGAASNPAFMACSSSPCVSGATNNPNIVTGNADPYAGTILPNGPLSSANAGACVDSSGPSATLSSGVLNLPPGRYCKGFNITGGVVNLSPGITVVDKQFNVSGGTVNGLNGTTLVLGNGFAVSFTNNAHLNIKAPASGKTAGIAMTEYADSPNTGYSAMMPDPSMRPGYSWKIQNSAFPTAPGTVNFTSGTLNFTGVIYMPRRLVYFMNAMRVSSFGGTAGCGHVIAQDMGTEYDLTLGDNCAGVGVLPFGSLATDWATAICQTPAGALDANCGVSVTGSATTATTPGSSVRIVQ